MSHTAFFFPVQQEAAGLLSRLTGLKKTVIEGTFFWRGRLGEREVFVGLLGMGGDSVRRNLPLLLKQESIEFAWVAGFGGGLDSTLKKGDVVLAENFSSVGLTFLKSANCVKGVTVDHVVASSTQKLALAKGHLARVVDMESAVAHQIFEERGIAHATVRGISDPWNESLPSGALSASFDSVKNRPRPIRLLVWLVLHPSDIKPFFGFVIGLSGVQKNLTRKLVEWESMRTA